MAVAGEALAGIGVPELSVDITLPTLVPAVAEAYGIAGVRAAALRAALDHKDAAAVAAVAGEAGGLFGSLLAAAGPAAVTLSVLDRLELPARARAERVRLGTVVDGLAAAAPELKVTVDPIENRGFEYHTGISFTFFAAAARMVGELGRGGRYQAGDPAAPEPNAETTFDSPGGGAILPSSVMPAFSVTSGRRCRMYLAKASFSLRASCSSVPTCSSITKDERKPFFRECRIRRDPQYRWRQRRAAAERGRHQTAPSLRCSRVRAR